MADAVNQRRGRQADRELRVAEFYSGLGGMHYALKGAGICFKVVAALEINTTANVVYRHNFPDTNVLQKNIEGFSVKDLNQLNAELFVMSPPCQPFTRLGNKGASSDPRTRSFLHILELLPRLASPPGYILMENVKGFETSDTRESFVETLKSCGYSYQEFLLSPPQFGIPNSRLRYYLLAKRKPLQFYFVPQDQVFSFIPCACCGAECGNSLHGQVAEMQKPYFACTSGKNGDKQNQTQNKENVDSASQTVLLGESRWDSSVDNNTDSNMDRNMDNCNTRDSRVDTNVDSRADSHCTSLLDSPESEECAALPQDRHSETDTVRCCRLGSKPVKCTKLAHFLEKGMSEDYFNEFLLPKKVLSKFALLLDIVTSESDHSCCFTKAYGHYAEGTGSVLKVSEVDDVEIFNSYRLLGESGKEEQKAAILSVLGLRYFTPREVANLQCLPQSFSFPPEITVKQQYRLLGNSLNVRVVTELLKCLLRGTSNDTIIDEAKDNCE